MYLYSYYAGQGRNLGTSVSNGTIYIREKKKQIKCRVSNGLVMEETTRAGNQCTILRYGRDLTVKTGPKITYQEFYEPGTLRAMKRGGLWKKQSGIVLNGTKGTLKCYSTSNGACSREVFTYDNGMEGYTASRRRKRLRVYRPNGKLWIVVEGRVSVTRYSLADQLKNIDRDFQMWRFMRGTQCDLTVYDTGGTTIVTQGHFANHQRDGKWLENRKECYYMSGVRVSRSLYEDDPDSWNPHDVLKIPNAQLRCSLLNRLGYDRLLSKVESNVIDSSPEGGQLIEIAADGGSKADGVADRVMHLIKVICPSTGQSYVLRVPPQIEKFEQARQWTFGLRQDSIKSGFSLNLVKET